MTHWVISCKELFHVSRFLMWSWFGKIQCLYGCRVKIKTLSFQKVKNAPLTHKPSRPYPQKWVVLMDILLKPWNKLWVGSVNDAHHILLSADQSLFCQAKLDAESPCSQNLKQRVQGWRGSPFTLNDPGCWLGEYCCTVQYYRKLLITVYSTVLNLMDVEWWSDCKHVAEVLLSSITNST